MRRPGAEQPRRRDDPQPFGDLARLEPLMMPTPAGGEQHQPADQRDGQELERRCGHMQFTEPRRAGDERARQHRRRGARQEQPTIGGGVARGDVFGRQQRLRIALRRGAVGRGFADRGADARPMRARRLQVAAVEDVTCAAAGVGADATGEILLEPDALFRRQRRADNARDQLGQRRLQRTRRDVERAPRRRLVGLLVGPQQSGRAVLGIDDDDRRAAPRRFFDDLAGAAAPLGRLAVPHRDEDVGLGEHRQARRFESRRQPLVERRGGIAGERQDERRAGARRERSEFLARRVVDERLGVDRRRAGQNDVEGEAGCRARRGRRCGRRPRRATRSASRPAGLR